MTGVRKPSYERITDKEVCPTDPDASPMHLSGGGRAVMGYSDHYIVDGGKSGSSSMLGNTASITDNTPLLDLVRWVCARWQLHPLRAPVTRNTALSRTLSGWKRWASRLISQPWILVTGQNFIPQSGFNTMPNMTNIFVRRSGYRLSSRRKSEQVYVYTAEASFVMPVL